MAGSKESKKFDHKSFLEKVSSRPGVYDMRDHSGKTLYIGKAKNLKIASQATSGQRVLPQNHGFV